LPHHFATITIEWITTATVTIEWITIATEVAPPEPSFSSYRLSTLIAALPTWIDTLLH
jgi:hypothetical protein